MKLKGSPERTARRFRFIQSDEENVFVDRESEMKLYFDINYMSWIILPEKAKNIYSMICYNSKVDGEGFIGRVDNFQCVQDNGKTWEQVDFEPIEVNNDFEETTTIVVTTTTVAVTTVEPTTTTTACTTCEEKFSITTPDGKITLKKLSENFYEQTGKGTMQIYWLPQYKAWILKPKDTPVSSLICFEHADYTNTKPSRPLQRFPESISEMYCKMPDGSWKESYPINLTNIPCQC